MKNEVSELNYPYSQEEYKKIGQAIGLIDTLLLKLEHETSEGNKLIKNLGGQKFGPEVKAAFEFAIGIDLDDMAEKSKEKIKSNNAEITRAKAIRERVMDDPKILLLIAEFIDIIYQPNQN